MGEFRGIEAVPEFAARWALEAAKKYNNESVLTATINASGGCPIGAKALCGEYCFAHRSWSEDTSPRTESNINYLLDAKILEEKGKEVGIFMSYDTEPFPGGVVCEISRKILLSMTKKPPAALLIHSHTANIGNDETVALIRDVSQATNVIVGIGFETDSENVGNSEHFHSVSDRLKAFEKLNGAGVKTQASTTPLLGFLDYPGFVKRFYEMGTHRVMIGELRKEFDIGGDERASKLDIGLPPLSEKDAMQICSQYNFPGGVGVREDFYVTMT
ncbi:hypothetical protein KBB89_02270 [Candidatus Gracilibacteria bacterium]|nr:hypothetical protein [Candidatus Gracilibacteria bacterium]